MNTMESPRSPKRRRILASINPPIPTLKRDPDGNDSHHRRPTSASASVSAWGSLSPGPAPPPTPGLRNRDIPAKHPKAESIDSEARQGSEPRITKLRFKSPRRHRSSREEDEHHRRHRGHHRDKDQDLDDDSLKDKDRSRSRSHSRRHRHHHRRSRSHSPTSSTRRHHHHRRKRHHTSKPSSSPKKQPPQEEEPEPNHPFEQPLDPEVAFRESLFDAMADDEGAAYWEGVYGQPIHTYSADRLNPHGELERMTEEEYAAHVRQKMWEKTHAGLVEEREKRKRQAEERAKKDGERARKDDENRRIQTELERSLKRGEQRRKKRVWRDRWEGYVERWARWNGKSVGGIPWPDEGGKKEVDAESLRAFFVNGLNLEELGEKEFAARLKDERVRWHPDKMQQRLGGTVEEGVMRDVTAIFQVVDELWNDTRRSL